MRVFGFIEAEKANFSIKFMCERLGVTRGGFYAWRRRPPSRRRIIDAAYTAVIKKIHADSRGNYGAPRICAELADDYNIRCGRKRVARLMRQAGIAGCHRRKRTWTTRRDDSQSPAPDRVNRQFAAAGPNELWVADITYVPTWTGFGYLATVLDVFSRRIVGWSYATHMRTELIVDAIGMAIETRRPPRGLIRGAMAGSCSLNEPAAHPERGHRQRRLKLTPAAPAARTPAGPPARRRVRPWTTPARHSPHSTADAADTGCAPATALQRHHRRRAPPHRLVPPATRRRA